MLTLSDKAKSLLMDLLPQRPEPAQLFRLAKQGSGFGLRFDEPAQGDIIFRYDDIDILAVTAEVAQAVDGTIDREDSPEGPRLVLVR